MTTVFGEKNICAIEYNINQLSSMMGNVRIWINGLYIGYFEEEVPLLSIQSSLNSISQRLDSLINANILQAKKEDMDLLSILLSLPENGKFIMSLGESFDDFMVFLFKDGSNVDFLWKLNEKLFFQYPNYPEGEHRATIDAAYFVTIIEQAQLFLQNKKP